MSTLKVYAAISAVQKEMAASGISKEQKAGFGNSTYKFRGVDDVYNALSPLLTKHKLLITPYVIGRETSETTSKNGSLLLHVTVEMEFKFISVEDGSEHIVKMYGEAMDTGDKATSKALSTAYKYAAFQTFCIPVDVPDSDANTYEVAAAPEAQPEPKVTPEVVVKISKAAEVAKVDLSKILSRYQVSSLSDLTQSQGSSSLAKLGAAA